MTIISIIIKVVLWLFIFLIVADVLLYVLVLNKERKKVLEDSEQLVSNPTSVPDQDGESEISSGSDDFQPGRDRLD